MTLDMWNSSTHRSAYLSPFTMEFPGHILTWNSFTSALDLLRALNLALGLALPQTPMEDSLGHFLGPLPCKAEMVLPPSGRVYPLSMVQHG